MHAGLTSLCTGRELNIISHEHAIKLEMKAHTTNNSRDSASVDVDLGWKILAVWLFGCLQRCVKVKVRFLGLGLRLKFSVYGFRLRVKVRGRVRFQPH